MVLRLRVDARCEVVEHDATDILCNLLDLFSAGWVVSMCRSAMMKKHS